MFWDKIKNKYIIALIFVVLLGGFLRVWKLEEKSFVADEFLGVNAVYGFFQTGEWKRWDFNHNVVMADEPYFKTFFDFDFWGGGETSYTRSWIFNIQTVPFLRIFSVENETAYRMASVVWGVISILAVYLISLRLTKNKILSGIAAFLMAISIDGIEFSRKMRMYAMFMPVFFIFSFYVFQFLEGKKKSTIDFVNKLRKKTGFNFLYLLPALLLGLLSMHLHLLAINIFIIVFVFFVVNFVIEKRKSGLLLNRYGVYLLIALGFAAVSCENIVAANFLGWEDHYTYMEKILVDYSDKYLAVLLLVLGSVYLCKKNEKAGIFVVSAFWTILLSAVFLWKRTVGEQYIYFIKPFQVILLGGGVYAVAKFLRDNLSNYKKQVFAGTIAVFLLVIPNYTYFFQRENTYTQTSDSENPDYDSVFGYFLKKKGADDVLITREFRNFYFSGADVKVYSLGGERSDASERKLNKDRLKQIMAENKCGWIIFSNNDEQFISNEAHSYIAKELEKITDLRVKGNISVYRWCNK